MFMQLLLAVTGEQICLADSAAFAGYRQHCPTHKETLSP
jgi:hypothetical protein